MRRCFRIVGGLVYALAMVCLLGSFSPAQRYTFREYVDGLGNLNVKCLYQDRAGFLWVGTHGGLFRYDGYRFEEFGPKDGLTSPMIEDVYEDAASRLWVATPNGLFVRSGPRFENVRLNRSPVSIRVGSRISSLSDGRVIVSADSGLYQVLSPTEEHGWQLRSLLPFKFIDEDTAAAHGMAEGPDGAIWFGCGSRLCKYNDGRLTKWDELRGVANDSWDYLLFDRKGQLWARGRSHIAVLRPGASGFEARDIPNAPANLDYRPLAMDSQGRILAPSDNTLARFEEGRWRIFSESNGLAGETVTAILADREGSVWIGVLGRGLARWLGYGQWEHWTKADGLHSNIVWRVLRDQTGRLWVGDDKGVSVMDPGSKQLHNWSPPGISTGDLASMAASKDGFVWLGFRNRYIARVDSGTGRTERFPVGDLSQIFVDSRDRVWAATLGGLFVSDPVSGSGQIRTPFYRVQGGALPEGGFEDITEAPDGRLWVACDDGLVTAGPEGWTRVELDWRELGSKTLLDVASDLDGNLWLDGYFSGIVRLKLRGSKVLHSDHLQKPTLLSDRFVLIARDGRGWMWFGGDHGIDVFDGRKWRRYTQDDGLVWNDTAAKAFLAEGDGSVWIGTGGGLSHFTPRTVLDTAPAPTFVWTRSGERDLSQSAVVEWSKDPLTIGLASLTFRNERAIRFRYRLRGLEPDWTETTQHEVRYPQLEPGSYRFEAVALAGSGQTLSPMSTFSFTILPPWWRTRTVYAATYAVILGLIYLAWRWSNRLIIARQNKLEAVVKERTRELEADKIELIEAKAALAEQASRDFLTGLLNRGAILRALEQEMRRSQRERNPFAVVLIDLDHFKDVNDRHGHLVGDEVLREFARRVNSCLRPYDHVGRFGGEEFLILLPGMKDESAGRIDELHRQITQDPFMCGDSELRVSCSFGVAWFRSELITTEALLDLADQALYAAKALGRNRVEAVGVPAASTVTPQP